MAAGAAVVVFVFVLLFMQDHPSDLGLEPYGATASEIASLAQGGSALNWFAVFYGLDWVATVPPTVRLTSNCFGRQTPASSTHGSEPPTNAAPPSPPSAPDSSGPKPAITATPSGYPAQSAL